MTRESTVGFMLWDGNSRGTLSNISRLIEQNKKVVVYVAPLREFVTLSSRDECESFMGIDQGLEQIGPWSSCSA